MEALCFPEQLLKMCPFLVFWIFRHTIPAAIINFKNVFWSNVYVTMIVWRTFFAKVFYREYLANILLSLSWGEEMFGMFADWIVWTSPKESPSLPLGGEFAFKYWDYFLVQTKNFRSVILFVLSAPCATARICTFCFSYHFRQNICLHFVRHITWNSAVEMYVAVVCLA
jgi:hypothetical protein